MSACLLVAGALLVGAYVFHHIFVRGKRCTSQARLDGKTVIVTGELRETPQTLSYLRKISKLCVLTPE